MGQNLFKNKISPIRKTAYGLFRTVIALHLTVTAAGADSYFWTVYDSRAGLPGNSITSVAVDPGGYVWAGVKPEQEASSPGGLAVLSRYGRVVSTYDTADNLPGMFISGVVFEAVREDEKNRLDAGAVWIATRQGLGSLSRRGTCTALRADSGSLSGDEIAAVFVDRSNTKWASVWGKGINCIDADFRRGAYTTTDGLCSPFVLSIGEDSRGSMWFGSQDRGVCCLDRQGSWKYYTAADSGLPGNCVRAIAEEPPDRLWFAAPEGVSAYDGRTWISYTSRNSPLAGFGPSALAVDAAGTRWIGTERGGLFKLDRQGVWAQFHKDNSPLPDNTVTALCLDASGAVWIATPSGLCRLGTRPPWDGMPAAPPSGTLPERRAGEADGQGQAPVSFAYGIVWENIGLADAAHSLSFALPAFFYGSPSWYYAAFWAKSEGAIKDFQYSINGDRRGNMRLQLNGGFSNASFLAAGTAYTQAAAFTPDKDISCPFPDAYPEELSEYLQPGENIPCKDPGIQTVVQSLIKQTSRGDMFKSACDIIYARPLQHTGLDERNIGLLTKNEPGEEDALLTSPKDVFYVLKNRTGDPQARARLLCTLARAAGIPARIVMSLDGSVWSQLWISGTGWIPVATTYPVCDYIRPVRAGIISSLAPEHRVLAAVSGRNDDAGRVMWNRAVKAYYVDGNPDELKGFLQTSLARLLILKIVNGPRIPDAARLQIGKNIFVHVRQQERDIVLIAQDTEGRELKAVPLSFEGLACSVELDSRFLWRFIPRKLADLVVLETLACTPSGEAAGLSDAQN